MQGQNISIAFSQDQEVVLIQIDIPDSLNQVC